MQLAIVKAEQAEVDAEYCADYLRYRLRARTSDGLSSYFTCECRELSKTKIKEWFKSYARVPRASDVGTFRWNVRWPYTKKAVKFGDVEARPFRNEIGEAVLEPRGGNWKNFATKDRRS